MENLNRKNGHYPPRLEEQTPQEQEMSIAFYFMELNGTPFKPVVKEGIDPKVAAAITGQKGKPDQHLAQQEHEKKVKERQIKHLAEANKK